MPMVATSPSSFSHSCVGVYSLSVGTFKSRILLEFSDGRFYSVFDFGDGDFELASAVERFEGAFARSQSAVGDRQLRAPLDLGEHFGCRDDASRAADFGNAHTVGGFERFERARSDDFCFVVGAFPPDGKRLVEIS